MARPKKRSPGADGYYKAYKTLGHEANGKPIIKVFRSKISKADAQRKSEEYLSTYNALANVTFDEWAEKWLWEYKEPYVRENTFEYTYRQTLQNHLLPYFRAFKLKDITNSMVQSFFNGKKSCSTSALSKMRICLMQIFDTAIANQIVKFNPCSSVKIVSNKQKAKTDTYTNEEVQQIINLSYLHRFGIYIHILIRMGLRVSELCGLMWEDIDFDKGTMTIQRACTDLNGKAVIGAPKSDKSNRIIPIPRDLLKELKTERKKGYLVVSPTGKNITPRTFTSKRYNVFFEEMGFRKLSPKQMRHTCGTLLYEKCHDIYAVKSFLGHADINVTSNVYVHANAQDLAKKLFE